MKNKMVDMTKRRVVKTQAEAAKAKQDASKNLIHVEHENQKKLVSTNPEITKETKTIMLD